jgi:hypothetical protein
MAVELHSIIQRVVRTNLFPQLLEEERRSSQSSAQSLQSATMGAGGSSGGGGRFTSSLSGPLSATAPAASLATRTSVSGASLGTSTFPSIGRTDARERRRLVQRVRALKTDIGRFETDFRTTQGREPKPAERGGMGKVYEEYRALKQIIRDSAALQIQAAYRGASVRRRLRAGKTGGSGPASGRTGAAAGTGLPGGGTGAPASTGAGSSSSSSSASARPTLSVRAAAPDAGMVKLNALRDEKASLKRKLRQYDADFSAQHGRAPTKAEKEHLRPQYTRYHELKSLIQDLEETVPGAKASRGRDADSPPPASSSSSSRHGTAATTAAPAAGGASRVGATAQVASGTGLGHSSSGPAALSTSVASSGSGAGAGSASASGLDSSGALSARTRSDSAVSDVGLGDDDEDDAAAHGSGGGSSSSKSHDSATSERISSLKAEKKKLQATLREYERDFAARHGRGVKYVKDIAPVFDKYTRYKQLKAQLKELGAG